MRRIGLLVLCALVVANCLVLPSCGQRDRDYVDGKLAIPYDFSSYQEPAPKNISDTLNDRDLFSIFLSDIADTELSDIISGGGPLTVFAPRNYAFEKLEDSSKEILSTNKQSLTSLLKYHILLGNFTADDLSDYSSLETIQGENLTISDNSNRTFTLGGQAVINKNNGIVCTNGMIYPIDSLLAPEDLRSQIKEKAAAGNSQPISRPSGPSLDAANSAPAWNDAAQSAST